MQMAEDTIKSIQLEPTSRCNLNCSTCLKPAYANSWQGCDLDEGLFARLLQQIRTSRPAVHLQGWGESLLHPRIFQFITELKKNDITATFSTNGTTLTNELADLVVESGLDGITFSMSGACPETQDPLRGSNSFKRLETSVEMIVAAKKNHGSARPGIAVSYLLTPETVRELPCAVAWCGRRDVDALACVAMTQVGTPEQMRLRFIIKRQEGACYRFLRMRTHFQALLRGVALDMKPFYPVLTPLCSKDPLHSLFISSRGDVSPCVFHCPPVQEKVHWNYGERSAQVAPLVFGNLADLTLQEIWEGEKYKRFRDTWRSRLEYHDERLSKVSYSMAGTTELERAVEGINEYFSRHPVPYECSFCAKTDGF